MSTQLAPPPLTTPLIESPKQPFITRAWQYYFRGLAERVQAAAFSATQTISLADQTAALGLTTLLAEPNARLYRVSYRVRLNRAATTLSSVQVALVTTEGGIVCTQQSAAYTGNQVNAPLSGVVIVKPDAATPVQYSVAYSSVGGTSARYDVDLFIESL